MSVETCTSAGMFFLRSAIAASNFSVSSIVPVFGCLVTVSNTAGFPLSDATPNLGLSGPILISAISANFTGLPLAIFTTDFEIRFTASADTTPRNMYSLPYS